MRADISVQNVEFNLQQTVVKINVTDSEFVENVAQFIVAEFLNIRYPAEKCIDGNVKSHNATPGPTLFKPSEEIVPVALARVGVVVVNVDNCNFAFMKHLVSKVSHYADFCVQMILFIDFEETQKAHKLSTQCLRRSYECFPSDTCQLSASFFHMSHPQLEPSR